MNNLIIKVLPIVIIVAFYSGANSALAQTTKIVSHGAVADAQKPYFPANLTESIEELKRRLPTKGNVLDEFKSNPIEIAIDYHLTLGRWIRNNWIHNGDGKLVNYFNKRGIYCADDMSGIMLDSLWKDLHGVPIGLEEQVAQYKKFWFCNSPTVREKRSIPADIWKTPLSLQSGSTIKLSETRGKITVLLLFYHDDTSMLPDISRLNKLQSKYAKDNVAFIGLEDFCFSRGKEKNVSTNYSTKFPVALIGPDSDFVWKLAAALMAPGDLEYPDIILIGKDGNMIMRFHHWTPAEAKQLDNEIRKAL